MKHIIDTNTAPCTVSSEQLRAISEINHYRSSRTKNAIIVGQAMVELKTITPSEDFAKLVEWGCGLKVSQRSVYLRIGKCVGHLEPNREERNKNTRKIMDMLFTVCPYQHSI